MTHSGLRALTLALTSAVRRRGDRGRPFVVVGRSASNPGAPRPVRALGVLALRAPAAAMFLLLALPALPIAALPAAAAQTVHSLGQVPGLLKTPESKQVFREQMEGAPVPDLLGLHLPPGLAAPVIARLLLPADNTAPLNAVGARPLPGQPDRYIAIVCTGGDIPTGKDDPRCSQYAGAHPPLHAYVGLIEAQPGRNPHLLARPASVDGMVDWRHTDLPTAPEALDDAHGDRIPASSWNRFDLAPYRIALGRTAFGLRGGWSDGFSGGMASYDALFLFAVRHGALREVLAVPMSSYQDLAGDWHKDGTRDHEISQGANILLVGTHRTDGHFDLLLKSRDGRHHRLYRWSAAAGAYRPVGK